jgi:hypothetical protein
MYVGTYVSSIFIDLLDDMKWHDMINMNVPEMIKCLVPSLKEIRLTIIPKEKKPFCTNKQLFEKRI